MAALPLQGSAALFAACHAPAPVAQHGCHESADGVAPAGASAVADAPSHGKCSTCASCCTTACAPPQSLPMPAPFPRASRALPAAEPLIAAVYPSGLERPPRAA